MGQYIALHAVQLTDPSTGARTSIEPRQEGKFSGLFEHEFDKKTEGRLLDMGAIRKPEGTEKHEDLTKVTGLHDSRLIEGAATSTAEPPKKETAAEKKARVAAEAAAAEAAAAAGNEGSNDDENILG